MANRVAVGEGRDLGPRAGRDLEAWRIADDVRSALASGMLRLQLFEATHVSRAARQATAFILAALSKLEELEEEGPGSLEPAVGSQSKSAARVGHG